MIKKVNLLHWLILLFFCVITGYSLAAVYVTDGNAAGFYNMGDQLALNTDEILLNSDNLDYESVGKRFTVTATKASITIDGLKRENDWQYLTVGLADLNVDGLFANLYYYNRGEYVGADRFCLKEGERQYRLSTPAFSSVKIVFWQQKEAGFSIETLRLSTKFMTKRAGEIWKYGFLFSLLCLPLAAWIYYFCKVHGYFIDWYPLIDFLQGFYIVLAHRMLRGRKYIFSEKIRKYMRIVIMMAIMAVLDIMKVCGLYSDTMNHRYLMIFFLVSILGLALLSVEGELKRRNWRNPLVLAWCIFWGMSVISDFIVKKSGNYFGFYGYFMFIVFGFLFFVWGNRKEKRDILWEICKAVEWSYLLSIVYCLICRPEMTGFRYKGIYDNPNQFGLYLAIAGGVFLCELEIYWKAGKRKLGRQLLYGMGYLSDIFFLWKTQCTTAVLALLLVTVFWLLSNIRYVVSHRKKSRILVTVALCVIFIWPVSGALQWGILNIPDKLDTTIVYPSDKEYAQVEEYLQFPIFTEEVYAAEISSSRIWKKLTMSTSLNTLLSGRLTCYAAYLRDMNLFGHEKRQVVYGSSSNAAHNGFLLYMHLYGIYIAIPYFIGNLYYFYYAAVYWKRSRAEEMFAFLPLSFFCIYFLENMFDTVDTPFQVFLWFLFMFVEGTLFHMIDGESEDVKNTI